jgi:hypothetical protein
MAEGRVNKVSQHREVFRATPAEVRELLARAAGCHLLEFTTTFPRIWPGSSHAPARLLTGDSYRSSNVGLRPGTQPLRDLRAPSDRRSAEGSTPTPALEGARGDAMLPEDTRELFNAYLTDLRARGDYARHWADDVSIEIVGTDQKAKGREATGQFIRYFHTGRPFGDQPAFGQAAVGAAGDIAVGRANA